MVADLRGFARPFTAIAGFAGESAVLSLVSPQVELTLQVELNLEVARKVQLMLQAEVGRQAQVRTARPASQMRSCRFASDLPDAK